MEAKISLGQVVGDTWRLLTFQLSAERMAAFGKGHLVFGLVCTWLVGMGRYWDDPRAVFAQKLGVGSVVYVFVLSALLWAIAIPLTRNPAWTYRRVLTYVALVSPPAAFYAIPVEQFMPLAQASEANAWFLGVVAAWRVALLFRFYSVYAGMRWFATLVTGLLPLTAIVLSLVVLNLQHVVFDLMGGNRDPSSADGAYGVVVFLSVLSVFLGPILGIIYLGLAGSATRNEKWEKQRSDAEQGP